MKNLLALLACVAMTMSATAQTNIYNPDSDEDGLITAEDLLIFLSLYGTPYEPNPCNCACYSNLFLDDFAHQNESVLDTITAQEVAANLFYAQPDSIRMDFVIAPYGVGELPFHNGVDTLYYDTLAFSQTYPFNFVSLGGLPFNNWNGGNPYGYNYNGYAGYGDGVAFMQYREPTPHTYNGSSIPYAYNIYSSGYGGGLDLVDDDYRVLRFKAEDVCPNMLNNEYWDILQGTEFFQVEDGVYVNASENAANVIATQNDPEMGSDWVYHYPLSWIVFTEIYVETEE